MNIVLFFINLWSYENECHVSAKVKMLDSQNSNNFLQNYNILKRLLNTLYL